MYVGVRVCECAKKAETEPPEPAGESGSASCCSVCEDLISKLRRFRSDLAIWARLSDICPPYFTIMLLLPISLDREGSTRIQLALDCRLEEERQRLKRLQEEQYKVQREMDLTVDHFGIPTVKTRHHSDVR
ncbi:hypothetical protein J6590_098375 [Homalodisca vitripennis]|nr:hypothetical protein J6590_078821 [Homalodisca vitripennis]KAG8334042.1 hypothetical protein J6590_098375 [Homalodisca vitripennis]